MALNNSFGLYRLIIENAVEVISVLDSQGTIQFVNSSAMRSLGYEPVELAGRNAFDLIHPEDRPIAHAALQSVFARSENAANKRFTCRIIKKTIPWSQRKAPGAPVSTPMESRSR